MSEAPGGGGYLPSRCSTSGRFTPAAATSISTSPAPGTGSGRSASSQDLGRPELRDLDAAHGCTCCSLQPRRQPRRRQQRRELAPARAPASVAPGLLLDVGADQVLAEVVVDHVAAVLVDEPHALLGPRLACTSRSARATSAAPARSIVPLR